MTMLYASPTIADVTGAGSSDEVRRRGFSFYIPAAQRPIVLSILEGYLSERSHSRVGRDRGIKGKMVFQRNGGISGENEGKGWYEASMALIYHHLRSRHQEWIRVEANILALGNFLLCIYTPIALGRPVKEQEEEERVRSERGRTLVDEVMTVSLDGRMVREMRRKRPRSRMTSSPWTHPPSSSHHPKRIGTSGWRSPMRLPNVEEKDELGKGGGQTHEDNAAAPRRYHAFAILDRYTSDLRFSYASPLALALLGLPVEPELTNHPEAADGEESPPPENEGIILSSPGPYATSFSPTPTSATTEQEMNFYLSLPSLMSLIAKEDRDRVREDVNEARRAGGHMTHPTFRLAKVHPLSGGSCVACMGREKRCSVCQESSDSSSQGSKEKGSGEESVEVECPPSASADDPLQLHGTLVGSSDALLLTISASSEHLTKQCMDLIEDVASFQAPWVSQTLSRWNWARAHTVRSLPQGNVTPETSPSSSMDTATDQGEGTEASSSSPSSTSSFASSPPSSGSSGGTGSVGSTGSAGPSLKVKGRQSSADSYGFPASEGATSTGGGQNEETVDDQVEMMMGYLEDMHPISSSGDESNDDGEAS